MQNAANSMVGYSVVQIARLMGLKTINIIRSDRPNVEKEFRLLDNMGGDINIPDNYLSSKEFQQVLKELPPIKLAFNAVGGDVVTDMARALSYGATLVSYGGMSKKPVTIPQELLNYKNLSLKGFWISKWNETHSKTERSLMIEDIAGWIKQNEFNLFMELHDFDDFQYALEKSMLPHRFRKIVLNMDYPDRMAELDMKSENPKNFEIFDADILKE